MRSDHLLLRDILITGTATYDNGMMRVGAAAGVPGVMTLASFADVLPGGIIHSGCL